MSKKYSALFLTILIVLSLLCGCGKSAPAENKSTGETSTQAEHSELVLDSVNIDGAAEKLLAKMSVEEKIGQLFIVSTDSLDMKGQTHMTKRMRQAIREYKPGGIIFFSYNFKTRNRTIDFINDMQETSQIPMLMGIDEEGGSVQRLYKVKSMGVGYIPSMYTIGMTADSQNAYKIGKVIANNLTGLGLNLDFAPVADVCVQDENTEIGDRSFGDDPDLVADMVAKEVQGLQDYNVSATLKHFPGQGTVKDDTHKGYANLDTTIDVLRKKEFKPFEAGIKADADLVMVSHVSVEPITQNEVPASLSKLMVNDILREELGFDGVVITDAMNMKVITKFYSSADAAIAAIKAGNDIILMPEDFEMASQALIDAVYDGDLSEERIDESVKRILKVKIKRGIIPLDSAIFD